MLPSSLKVPLSQSADQVIKRSLSRGGQTFNGVALQKPTDEVAALRLFLLGAVHGLAYQWGQIVRPWYKLTLTSVFTHKTPMATYHDPDPVYGHAHQLHSCGTTITGWECELADLLVVVDFPVRGGNWTQRQAGLVQGKTLTAGRLALKTKEYKQHHLMTCWPDFTLAFPGVQPRRTRKLKGLPVGAGVYGMIDLQAHRWTIRRPRPHGQLFGGQKSFGTWLAELATGEEGSAADWRDRAGKSRFRPMAPREWPWLVDDLLRRTGRQAMTSRYPHLPFVGQMRGQSHVVCMIDAAGPEPVVVRRELRPLSRDPMGVWSEGGGGDAGPGEDRGEPGAGPISVLHIRLDPVEG
jgi:hypothetical protein